LEEIANEIRVANVDGKDEVNLMKHGKTNVSRRDS
jgi:hypothetical protein